MDVLNQLQADQLLSVLTSGALVTDRQGLVIYANPVFERMAGLSASRLIGQPACRIFKLPPKTDCALCLKPGAHAPEERAAVHGAFLPTANDEEVRVKIKHSQLSDDAFLSLIDPFSEDATLTQAHSDFVSTVSHEFRTPLTSIKGFADTLLAYGAQLPEEDKRRFVNIIKDQADRLIRLVENLLTVSKLGASRMEMSYRPVPLARLLEKITHGIGAKSKTPRRFEMEIHPEALEAWADADRLEQVLINLVDNAAKYSPEGAPVHIRAEYLPEDDGMVRISVRDEGIGIPPELLPQIFTKFYRAESPLKQEVEGTGLGLYITKSLTTAMGGQIHAESTVGRGSMFTVILPAATPERQAVHRRRLAVDEPEGGLAP